MARNLGVPYTEEQPYYFISYNSEDEKRVAAYAAVLAKHKVPIWYDNGIEVGEKFETIIAEKIDRCEAVIMFLSKNIFLKESSYVHKEFRLATEGSDKTVFPVILDELKLSQVPARYRSWWIDVTDLQCVNAYDYASAEESMQKLLESAELLTVDAREMQKASVQSVTERIRYENGDVYEGEVQDGQPHGKGKYVYANGDVYEGDFSAGVGEGKGRYAYANGDVYEGAVSSGFRYGYGKMLYANGDVYEGNFLLDGRNGKGKMTYASGRVEEGEFMFGVYVGK